MEIYFIISIYIYNIYLIFSYIIILLFITLNINICTKCTCCCFVFGTRGVCGWFWCVCVCITHLHLSNRPPNNKNQYLLVDKHPQYVVDKPRGAYPNTTYIHTFPSSPALHRDVCTATTTALLL